MTPRERFHAVMNFQPFDRLPMVEWATWWDKTTDRWHAEGLPETLTDRYDLYRHFGLDVYWQDWIPATLPSCPQPATNGAPLIATMAEYEAIRPHILPDVEFMVERWKSWEKWSILQERGEAVLWFTLEGFFWFPRVLLGIEPHPFRHVPQSPANPDEYRDSCFWHGTKKPVFGAGVPESVPFRRGKPQFVQRLAQGEQYSSTAL